MKKYYSIYFCENCGFRYSYIGEELESCPCCESLISILFLEVDKKVDGIIRTIFLLNDKEFLSYLVNKFKEEDYCRLSSMDGEKYKDMMQRIDRARMVLDAIKEFGEKQNG